MAAAMMLLSPLGAASGTSSTTSSCVNGAVADGNNKSYTIQCNSDTDGGITALQNFDSGDYTQCMPACDSTSGCTGWTWFPYETGGGFCLLNTGQQSLIRGSAGDVSGLTTNGTGLSESATTDVAFGVVVALGILACIVSRTCPKKLKIWDSEQQEVSPDPCMNSASAAKAQQLEKSDPEVDVPPPYSSIDGTSAARSQ